MELREKVIKGFECCLPMTTRDGHGDCDNCPYDRPITLEGGVCECIHELMIDALELVKKQEPKPPIIKENSYGWKFYYCASCGREFYQNNKFSFCEKCGQAVKWE